MCAITAGLRGRNVLVLERANKIGKKILMSGGGRCNFTNINISANNYLSQNPHFCKSALSRYTQWDFIELVRKHGIEYHEKTAGQLFCDNSSKDILSMLETECHAANVDIKTGCDTNDISFKDGLFELDTSLDRIRCQSLVIATGGLSIPTLGGSDIGYKVARQFGHNIFPQRAGLVPLVFTDQLRELMGDLSGLSIRAAVATDKTGFTDDILFTHRGLSGPAILQLSSYWQDGESITLNLLPDIEGDFLLAAKKHSPGVSISRVLHSMLPKRLINALAELWWKEVSDVSITEITNEKLRQLQTQFRNWKLTPAGTEGYRTAEITLGGVGTNELSSRTMESNLRSGLFFVGEVVDVAGHLGGYNFQWAWSSGHAAGEVV